MTPNAEKDVPPPCPVCGGNIRFCECMDDPFAPVSDSPIPPSGGMPDPASLTPEESARWAEALDGRHRPIPPGVDHE